MDTSGSLAYHTGLFHMALTVIGYSPMQGGRGLLIIHGDGLLFTMVDGFTILITDGHGFPQPVQQKRIEQPSKQQPVQQKHIDQPKSQQPDKQKPSRPPKYNQPKKEND